MWACPETNTLGAALASAIVHFKLQSNHSPLVSSASRSSPLCCAKEVHKVTLCSSRFFKGNLVFLWLVFCLLQKNKKQDSHLMETLDGLEISVQLCCIWRVSAEDVMTDMWMNPQRANLLFIWSRARCGNWRLDCVSPFCAQQWDKENRQIREQNSMFLYVVCTQHLN